MKPNWRIFETSASMDKKHLAVRFAITFHGTTHGLFIRSSYTMSKVLATTLFPIVAMIDLQFSPS